MTYSFPCQDLSLAGKQRGMAKGSSTRSGLLWEVERILDECKGELPQVLLMENVPQVIGKKNIKDFQLWRSKLESLGYQNYVQLLNAKNYGIPQNRNRCFMVSILGNYYYEFPKKKKLKLKLKDMLEDSVDEKYYLSDKMYDFILRERESWCGTDKAIINKSIAGAITTREGCTSADSSTYIDENLEENIDLRKLHIKEATKKGYAEAKGGDGVYINRPHQKRGVVQKDMIQTIKTSCDDIGVVVEDE